MCKVIIEYELKGKLREVWIVALELENETGMQPCSIVYDGKRLKYNANDLNELIIGNITESEYIDKYLVL